MAVQIPSFAFLAQPTVMQGFGQAQDIMSRMQAQHAQQIQNQFLPGQLKAQLQSQLLANQLAQSKAKYADPMEEAQLGLMQAQAERQKQLANLMSAAPQTMGAYTIGDQGVQFMPTQQAQPGQLGGMMGGAPSAVPSQMPAVGGAPAGGVMTLPSAASKYSAAGGTLYDPQTGNAVSIPTKETTAKFQQALTAEGISQPLLKKIYQDIAPEIGMQGSFGRALGHLGFPSESVSAYKSAIQTEIPQSTEQLLKAYNIPATQHSISELKHSIMPRWNDNADSYGRRIADTLAAMLMRSGQYKKYLKGGVSLQEAGTPHEALSGMSNQIYDELVNSVKGPDTGPTQLTTPQFDSKEDFRKWYAGLSVDQQAQVRKQMGGR